MYSKLKLIRFELKGKSDQGINSRRLIVCIFSFHQCIMDEMKILDCL
jgi:hypothetical protein